MFKNILHRGWRTSLLLGNIVLGIIFLTQIGVVAWLVIFGKLEVPDFILADIKKQLSQNEIELEITDLELNIRGYLNFKQLELRFAGDKEAFLNAKNVVISLRPWEILGKNMGISDLKAGEINLYSLSSDSPGSERVPIISDLYFSAHRTWKDWKIHLLRGHFGPLKLLLVGRVQLDYLNFASDGKPLKTGEIRRLYSHYCKQILSIQDQAQSLTEPFLAGHIRSSAEFPLSFRMLYYANGFNYLLEEAKPSERHRNKNTGKQRIELAALSLRGEVGLDSNWKPYGLSPIRLEVDKLSYGDILTTKNIELVARWNEKNLLEMPSHASLFAYDIESYGLEFESLVGSYHESRSHPISTQFSINQGKNWLDVSSQISLPDKTAELIFDAYWDPIFFLQAKPIKDSINSSEIGFASVPRWKGVATWKPGWELEQVRFNLNTKDFHYKTLKVTALHTDGIYKNGELRLSDTAIHTKDYTVKGGYWHRFSDLAYRFILHGNLRPLDISFIVDEDWWPELWNTFQFDQALPYASIDLRGRYHDGASHKWMFGFSRLPECTYRGVPIESATAYLWQLPKVLNLLDLDIQSEGHQALVNLQWTDVLHGKDHYSLAIGAAGNIPLAQLAKIVPEAEDYAELFASNSPPHLQLAALSYGEDSPKNGELFLNFNCHYTEPLIFESIRFDTLQFQGFSSPGLVELPQVTLEIADGVAHGNAVLKKHKKGKPSIQFHAALTGANGNKLIDAIPFLSGKKSAASAKKKVKKSKVSQIKDLGVVDFSMDGKGRIGHMKSFHGKGELLIKKGHLGQLNLFGGLLNFMRSINLDLGTVVFTGVKTKYLWKNGFIHLPNGEIFGPTARIDANGNYNLDTSKLDFLLTIHPLGSFSIPVFSQLLDVFSPLANAIQIYLRGTLDKPQWSLNFKPLNVFTGSDKVAKPKAMHHHPKKDSLVYPE